MPPAFGVFDDWLAPDVLARVRAWLAEFSYFTTTPTGKRGPIGTLAELSGPLAAGTVKLLGGQFVVYRAVEGVKTERTLYPSGTPVDAILDSVRARMSELEPWLGREREDWQLLGAGPRHYPRGRGLPLHDDARFTGTFTLYLHDEWRREWGGELVVGEERVFPEPNRMVFLRAGVPHEVEPVDDAAGGRLRMSVIGYGYRVDKSSEKR